MTAERDLLNLMDYERAALAALPVAVRDYYAGASMDKRTLRDNRGAWQRMQLLHRVLRGVGERQLDTTALGQPLSMPLLVAPTAFQAMAHPQGELATARAVAQAGLIMCLSTLSNTPVEQVTATGARVWFQLYVFRDRGLTEALVRRAEEAGCEALVLTVDAPVLGTREADVRNRFKLPPGLRLGNLEGLADAGMTPSEAGSALAKLVHDNIDPNLDWSAVSWLRERTRLPIVIKGIGHPLDASLAVDHGAAAVVVSNHGGRQLDGGVPTATLLPKVVDAVNGHCEVMVDGGVRRGGDVLAAVALGARAVLVGRPVLWGLAVNGQEGVGRVLEILRRELDETLALVGCSRMDQLSRDFVYGVQ